MLSLMMMVMIMVTEREMRGRLLVMRGRALDQLDQLVPDEGGDDLVQEDVADGDDDAYE